MPCHSVVLFNIMANMENYTKYIANWDFIRQKKKKKNFKVGILILIACETMDNCAGTLVQLKPVDWQRSCDTTP